MINMMKSLFAPNVKSALTYKEKKSEMKHYTRISTSSKKDDWCTPIEFFTKYDEEYDFTIDAAADASNALCDGYFDITDDGLSKSWAGERVWCNPPYGRGITGKWVKKAYEESEKCLVVMLIPSSTDTKYFHDYIWDSDFDSARDGVTINFVKGRIRFVGAANPAPFRSMVVIFDRRKQ